MSESEVRAKLDHILETLEKIERVIDRIGLEQQSLMIWRATVEEQLRNGVKSFAVVTNELEKKIDKRMIFAYIAGAAGGAAGLLKLLGG